MYDNHYSGIKQFIDEVNLSPYLHATNHRLGVIAFRLIYLFNMLRNYDKDSNSLTPDEKLNPCKKDIIAAIGLADVFFEHAIRL